MRLTDAICARSALSTWQSHLLWGPRDLFCLMKEYWIPTCTLLFGAQPVLPGQYHKILESPSDTFLHDLQGDLNRWPPVTYRPPITPLMVLSLSHITSCWLVMFWFVAALTSQTPLLYTIQFNSSNFYWFFFLATYECIYRRNHVIPIVGFFLASLWPRVLPVVDPIAPPCLGEVQVPPPWTPPPSPPHHECSLPHLPFSLSLCMPPAPIEPLFPH